MSNVLYRVYDEDGRLLYVGITNNPPARFRSHRATKQWWAMVAHIFTKTYDSRAALREAEREAIKTEHPTYNVVHNAGRDDRPTDPVLFTDYCAACETLGHVPHALTMDGDSVHCEYRCACDYEWSSNFSRSYPSVAAGMPGAGKG